MVSSDGIKNISRRKPVRKTVSNPAAKDSPIETLRLLVSALEACLARGACEPDVEAVHRARTGTRRIEAQLEVLEQALEQAAAGESQKEFLRAIKKMRNLLKKIRRTLAPAREMDVHRHLLGRLGESIDGASEAAELDQWLQEGREPHARQLQRSAAKWAGKLEENFVRLVAGAPKISSGQVPPDALRSALGSFAELVEQMPTLTAENLHDFRKGAKKARYMAEAGGTRSQCLAVAKKFKKIQDVIGAWHDWLVLAEETRSALGEGSGQLASRIEAERERSFREAMQVSGDLRGQLMAKWQAVKPQSGSK